MSEILAKISSYNIFNYLFPGAVFATLADRMDVLDPPSDNVVERLVWYYFIGLVVSRIGSIAVEPVLKKLRIIKHYDYAAYVRACGADPKIETLVEAANTYRTLAAGSGLLLLSLLCVWVSDRLGLSVAGRDRVIVGLLLVLFLASIHKQSAFVSARVAKCESDRRFKSDGGI